MAKKELDKLSLDMIQCEKDGYGVWYGRWKATQPIKKPDPVEVIPEGSKICAYCGKPFKPRTKKTQLYCEAVCQYQAQYERRKEKATAYHREWKERKKAEMGG